LAWIIVIAYQILTVLLLTLPISLLGTLIMWIVFSLHGAALLSAFLCLPMSVQIPWLPFSMCGTVLEKVEWFIGMSSFYHEKQFDDQFTSALQHVP